MRIKSFRLLGLVLLILTLQGCVMYSTKSTEVGVRVKKIAFLSGGGVDDKVYAPGATYFFFPFINDWYTFDTKLQNMEMTLREDRGDLQDLFLSKTVNGLDFLLNFTEEFAGCVNDRLHDCCLL